MRLSPRLATALLGMAWVTVQGEPGERSCVSLDQAGALPRRVAEALVHHWQMDRFWRGDDFGGSYRTGKPVHLLMVDREKWVAVCTEELRRCQGFTQGIRRGLMPATCRDDIPQDLSAEVFLRSFISRCEESFEFAPGHPQLSSTPGRPPRHFSALELSKPGSPSGSGTAGKVRQREDISCYDWRLPALGDPPPGYLAKKSREFLELLEAVQEELARDRTPDCARYTAWVPDFLEQDRWVMVLVNLTGECGGPFMYDFSRDERGKWTSPTPKMLRETDVRWYKPRFEKRGYVVVTSP